MMILLFHFFLASNHLSNRANKGNKSGPFRLREQVRQSGVKRGDLALVPFRQLDEIGIGNLSMSRQGAAGKAGQIIHLQIIGPKNVARQRNYFAQGLYGRVGADSGRNNFGIR